MENKYSIFVVFIILFITFSLSFIDVKNKKDNKNEVIHCLKENDLIFKIINNSDTNIYEKGYKSHKLIFVNSIIEGEGIIRDKKIINIDKICDLENVN